MIKAIFRHEMLALFRTPLAWLLLGLGSGLIAFQFLAQIEFYLSVADKLKAMEQAPGVSQLVLVPTIGFCAMVTMFLVPIVTMLSIAGERNAGTVQLITSSPVRIWSFVLGKFFSLCSIFIMLWLIVAVMAITLLWGTQLDLGLYLGGLGALVAFTLAAVSIGISISALMKQPIAAGCLCLVTLLFLWFCDWANASSGEQNFFSYLASSTHFNRMASGLFDSFDVVYFLALTLLGLGLTHWRLSNERYFG